MVKNAKRIEEINDAMIANTDTFIGVSEKNVLEVTNKVPIKVITKNTISFQLTENL